MNQIMRSRVNAVTGIAAAATLCLAGSPLKADQYFLSALANPTGATAYGSSINDLGQVCGLVLEPYGKTGKGGQTEFGIIWKNGVITKLDPSPSSVSSAASSINESGQVVGNYSTSSGQSYGFEYDAGVYSNVGVSGSTQTNVSAISNTGYIIGYSSVSGEDEAFIVDGTTLYDLGDALLGSGGYPDGVNDSGDIAAVGSSGDVNEAERWNLDSSFDITSVDYLGDLGGSLDGYVSECTSINDNGDIAGWAISSDGLAHACLWQGTTAIDLGVAPGCQEWANGINEFDDVCGYSYPTNGSGAAQTAFVTYDGGPLTDLNTLVSPTYGWVLQSATGINDYGQIAAIGNLAGSTIDGTVVLSPMATDVTTSFKVKIGAVSYTTSPAKVNVTIKNKSSVPVRGPIDVVLTNLTPGDTVTNATGVVNGDPYIELKKVDLAAGAQQVIAVKINAPGDAVSFGVDVQSGFEAPAL